MREWDRETEDPLLFICSPAWFQSPKCHIHIYIYTHTYTCTHTCYMYNFTYKCWQEGKKYIYSDPVHHYSRLVKSTLLNLDAYCTFIKNHPLSVGFVVIWSHAMCMYVYMWIKTLSVLVITRAINHRSFIVTTRHRYHCSYQCTFKRKSRLDAWIIIVYGSFMLVRRAQCLCLFQNISWIVFITIIHKCLKLYILELFWK